MHQETRLRNAGAPAVAAALILELRRDTDEKADVCFWACHAIGMDAQLLILPPPKLGHQLEAASSWLLCSLLCSCSSTPTLNPQS